MALGTPRSLSPSSPPPPHPGRGQFSKGQSLCKLSGCQDDFDWLIWPSRGKFFSFRISVQNVSPVCENQLPSDWKHEWNPSPRLCAKNPHTYIWPVRCISIWICFIPTNRVVLTGEPEHKIFWVPRMKLTLHGQYCIVFKVFHSRQLITFISINLP